VYELKADAFSIFPVDHHWIIINDTGEFDKDGKPVCYIYSLDKGGLMESKWNGSVYGYVNAMGGARGGITIENTMTYPDHDLNCLLIGYMKDQRATESYSFFFHNCNSTYYEASAFIDMELDDDDD